MFTRKDAIKLSGLTRTQIGYLEKLGIINPLKPNKRVCLYSWSEVLELRFIAKVRDCLSLQKITSFWQELNILWDIESLKGNVIVVVEDSLLVTPATLGNVFDYAFETKGKTTIHGLIFLRQGN